MSVEPTERTGPIAPPPIVAPRDTTSVAARADRNAVVNAAAMLIADTWALAFTNLLALEIRTHFAGPPAWDTQWSLMWTLTWLAGAAIARLYPGYALEGAENLRRTASVSALSALSILAALFVRHNPLDLSRASLLLMTIIAVPFSLMARYAFRHLLASIGRWGVPALVTGDLASCTHVTTELLKHPEFGFVPQPAPLNDRLELDAAGFRDDGPVFLAAEGLTDADRETVLEGPLGAYRRVLLVAGPPGRDIDWSGAVHLGSIKVLELRRRHLDPVPLRLKRLCDLLVVLVALPVLAPLIAIIAALVKLDSPGPAFYTAERMGWRGRAFRCWKFRSMHEGAEERLAALLERDSAARDEYLVYHKLRNDPRVTRIGRFLRRTSLDELPQLLNVILGDMSLVGPRPYLPREKHRMEPHTRIILSCRPGMTGYWQISGRNGRSFEERVDLDVTYVRRWSIWLDVHILLRTFSVLLTERRAF